jgi:flagellin-like hook-associated protein FlgL
MSNIYLSIVFVFVFFSIVFADEKPIIDQTENKYSQENCRLFIKNEVDLLLKRTTNKANTTEFKCKNLFSDNFIRCDNEEKRVIYDCEEGKASLRVYSPNTTDWKLFHGIE